MNLTPHFTLEELTVTATGLPNKPHGLELERLHALALFLECIRTRWNGPITITSGYRSPAVNRAVGGVSSSRHVSGEAADIKPASRFDRLLLWRAAILPMFAEGWPFDEAILYEDTSHIHVGYTVVREPERQLLVGTKGTGKYINWDRYVGPLKD